MMKLLLRFACALLLLCAGSPLARADDSLKKAQQELRDQGFYYGSIDGMPGDETTQAVRRYQIRNGLAVTGQLNDETRRSLDKNGSGGSSSASTRPTHAKPDPKLNDDRLYAEGREPAAADPPRVYDPPAPVRAAPPVARPLPDADSSDDSQPPARPARPDLRAAPRPDPNHIAPSPALTAIFERTPYELAPPPVQAQIVQRAQLVLLRTRFFGGQPDGTFGPDTTQALLAFQNAHRLRPTGRLDMNTLFAMRLLPNRPTYGPPGYYYNQGFGPRPPTFYN